MIKTVKMVGVDDIKVEITPAFKTSLGDLKSTLRGLSIMALGTFTTALLDVLIKYIADVDISGVIVNGIPVFAYLVPVVTAILNYVRKYITQTINVK